MNLLKHFLEFPNHLTIHQLNLPTIHQLNLHTIHLKLLIIPQNLLIIYLNPPMACPAITIATIVPSMRQEHLESKTHIFIIIITTKVNSLLNTQEKEIQMKQIFFCKIPTMSKGNSDETDFFLQD